MNILVVDDSELYREALNQLIRGIHHNCIAAGTLPDAVYRLETFRPDVALIDVSIPSGEGRLQYRYTNTGGFAVVEEILQKEYTDCRIILHSGLDLRPHEIPSELHIWGILPKPTI